MFESFSFAGLRHDEHIGCLSQLLFEIMDSHRVNGRGRRPVLAGAHIVFSEISRPRVCGQWIPILSGPHGAPAPTLRID
jgi:hypothetical protein